MRKVCSGKPPWLNVKRSAIWVLPNGQTAGLVAVLMAMWYAGASQSNGAAYLLCFITSGMVMVSALHAWANLRGLVIEADSPRPVFAGDDLVATLHLRSERHRPHFGLRLSSRGAGTVALDELVRSGREAIEMRVPALRRGLYQELPIEVMSRFPLGFFTAKRSLRLRVAYAVYPQPDGSRPLPVSVEPARQTREGTHVEGDDFGGVRAWRPGESQRHIDWKAAARGQPLLIKQWAGDADDTLLLDWELLTGMPTETRLGQLARWTVAAERNGSNYGLRIPGVSLGPSRGEAHYHACLRALAAFEEPSSDRA